MQKPTLITWDNTLYIFGGKDVATGTATDKIYQFDQTLVQVNQIGTLDSPMKAGVIIVFNQQN